ncbi:hypothetical protein INT45_002798, partial [Circinella minor]
YEFGILTGIMIMPYFQNDLNARNISEYLLSAMMAGAFGGSLCSGYLADRMGRRGSMCLATIIFLLGGVLQVAADHLVKIYAGRVITGISIGLLSMVVPLYQSEIAPKNMRGRLVSIQQLAIAFGISVSYWIGYGFLDVNSPASWRLPLGIPLVIGLIYAIGILLMPRSPRYLIHCHMDLQALEVLAFIRGDGSLSHPEVLMEYVEIKQSMRFEETYGSKHYGRLFQKGWENNRKRLLLGIAVQAFQQLTGANSLLFLIDPLFSLYAPQIFQALGIVGGHGTLLGKWSNNKSIYSNAISGIINLVFSIPPVFFIDRFGRRPTLVIGTIVCCICMIVMAIVGAVTGLTDNIRAIYAPGGMAADIPREIDIGVIGSSINSGGTVAFLVVMYLFIASYALTWAPVGWIFPTELYSQDVRAQALGITTAANWLFNYGVTQITPIMFVTIRWKTFAAYAVVCVVIGYLVYRYFPETMGKSLEEIDLIFSGNFNYYDLNVHHPQTAAAALDILDRAHAYARNSNPLNPQVVEGLFGDLTTPSVRTPAVTPFAQSTKPSTPQINENSIPLESITSHSTAPLSSPPLSSPSASLPLSRPPFSPPPSIKSSPS